MVSRDSRLINSAASGNSVQHVQAIPTQPTPATYFDVQWTYEEWLEELKKPIEYPDRNNPDDPGYYKKYAHNVAHPDLYYNVPDRKDAVATTDKTKNDRRVYFGWNNLQDYEIRGMNALKQYVAGKGLQTLPCGFEERDWLKWIQASFYDVKKSGDKLITHLEWLGSIPPEPRLNNHTVRLLQTGCFYMHGRDKWGRPCFVMDGRVMADVAKNSPELITADMFNSMFQFMFQYLKRVMLIPGHVEQWVSVCDLNNMSMTSLPRKQILAFGNLCQANLMYFLFRSFYTNVGWGQRLFYKGVQMFIDEETKLKIVLDGEGAPQGLVDLFHPSQLEQRFGGTQPTPTHFWPPFMGQTYISDADKAALQADNKMKIMSPDAYDKVLGLNPELMVHPKHMTEARCENKHFKLVPVQMPTQSDAYNLGTMQSEGEQPQQASNLRVGSIRTDGTGRESIYMDAYTGYEEIEEAQQIQDNISHQIGPKLIVQAPDFSVSTAANVGANQATAVNSATTQASVAIQEHSSPSNTSTSVKMAIGHGTNRTSMQTVDPTGLPKATTTLEQYDPLKNLPVVDSKGRRIGQAPPEQSCCSCKCTIF